MYYHHNIGYFDEEDLRYAGFNKIAGADEVGRGALSASVVVCCCMLPIKHEIVGLQDSKALTPKKREELSKLIIDRAICLSLASATNEEIDMINIYNATKKCVVAAIKNMKVYPEFVFVDGNLSFDDLAVPYMSIPGGDGAQIYDIGDDDKKKLVGHHYENVAAASIVAKVYRDSLMIEYDKQWPQYKFSKNKGYGSKEHYAALQEYGPCPIHRHSFRGVG